MKDIKSLYIKAKSSGKRQDIDTYMESVQLLLENNPIEYVSNLEYIILSNIGLSTLNEFVERYGLPLPLYDTITEYLNEGLYQCEIRKIDGTPYTEAIELMDDFKDNYQNCFNMYEYFKDELDTNDYLESYFNVMSEGKSKRTYQKFFNKYGKAAAPDIIINAADYGFLESVLDYWSKENIISTPVFKEWIVESCKDFCDDDESLSNIRDASLSAIVENVQHRKDAAYREAVLSDVDQVKLEYTQNELDSLNELISFKEYQSVCCEDVDDIISKQQEITSLYETLSTLVDDVDEEYLEFWTNPKSAAIKQIRRNMEQLLKEVSNRVRDEIIVDVDRINSELGTNLIEQPYFQFYISPTTRQNPTITKHELEKLISANLTEFSSTDNRFLNNIALYIYIAGVYQGEEIAKRILNIYINDVAHALRPLRYQEKISFKQNPDVYEDNLVTMNSTMVVYMSKEELLMGVDLSMLESIGDNIVPMLPQPSMSPNVIHEDALGNTRNKKTGGIPDYLKRNHDLGYGEDDDSKEEPDMDDFKRPSASKSEDDDIDDLDNDVDMKSDEDEFNRRRNGSGGNTTNYYYYTYTNSNNTNKTTNTNSYNQSNSHNKRHDQSHHQTVHGDYDNSRRSYKESTPWKLNISNILHDELFEEGFIDSSNQLFQEFDNRLFHYYSETDSNNESNFNYTYRIVRATDGDFYLVTFDIGGPGVVNYKLHYPHADDKTVRFVGKMSEKFLRKYGNDNYVSKGNKVLLIENLRTGEKVDRIEASGGVPAKGKSEEVFNSEYKIGGRSPLTYKSTIPIYTALSHAFTDYGNMQGINVTGSPVNFMNPFLPRRIDFSKPVLYKEKYQHLGNILKDILIGIGKDLTPYRSMSTADISKSITDQFLNHNLYRDYKIHPIPMTEFNGIMMSTAIFIKNCANNLHVEPYAGIPNLFNGLVIGFFGAPFERKPRFINIDILESIHSPRYRAKSNIFQNVYDWFSLAGNVLAHMAVPKKKRGDYLQMVNDCKDAIMEVFFTSNSTGSTFGESVMSISNMMEYDWIGMYESHLEEELEGIEFVMNSDVYKESKPSDEKPESDDPLRDFAIDLDRSLMDKQQKLKKKVQGAQAVTGVFIKPAKRTAEWVNNMVVYWKDMDETKLKEKMVDPHNRSNIFKAIKVAIAGGSLYKAGLLLNPVFATLTILKTGNRIKNGNRIRNEIVGELKAELEIIDKKIEDCGSEDRAAKYKLMRLRNEINKKLIRVGTGPTTARRKIAKMI